MSINRTPFVDEEIWKLKFKNKKPENKSTPPELIDTPLELRNFEIETLFRLAKSDVQLDLLIGIQQGYKEWLNQGNSGSTQDYLDSLSMDELKELSLMEGGLVDKANRPKQPSSVKK